MSGEIRIVDNSGEVLRELERRVERALEAVGQQAEGDAKLELENSPRRIDTGLLRNSITHAVSGEATAISSYKGDNPSKYGGTEIPTGTYSGTAPNDSKDKQAVYIGTNLDYAPYVHEGARLPNGGYMEPNRFLKNAAEKNGETYKRIIKRYMENG